MYEIPVQQHTSEFIWNLIQTKVEFIQNLTSRDFRNVHFIIQVQNKNNQ